MDLHSGYPFWLVKNEAHPLLKRFDSFSTFLFTLILANMNKLGAWQRHHL